MDILISRNGEQSGPYSDEDVLAMLRAGKAKATDMAWRPGMGDWLPLQAVLGLDADTVAPSAAPTVTPPTAPAAAVVPDPAKGGAPAPSAAATKVPENKPEQTPSEPATQRQKAFLTYMSMPFSSDLSREKAAQLVNEAMADPKRADRAKRWERERLRLFPDLFAEELKAQKENRAQHFLEACQKEGANYFEGITKAHTQVLVAYLDVHHPNWDHGEESVQYFFAAVSEKFPQLVKKAAKGQLKYPDNSRVGREIATKESQRSRARRSPLMAALRGVVVGLILLAVLYGGVVLYERNRPAVEEWLAQHSPTTEDEAFTQSAPDLPREEPPSEPVSPPAQQRVIRKARIDPATPVSRPRRVGLEPTDESEPAIAVTKPLPTPTPAASDPASTPAPTAVPSLPEPASAATVSAPATPAPRTAVTIVRPTSVVLKFGVSTLSAGVSVPLVSVEGQTARVRFGSEVVAVPLVNTDFDQQ